MTFTSEGDEAPRPLAGGVHAATAARRLAPRRRGRHPCPMNRTLTLLALSLVIALLTLFVSRKFGFTFLFLPLFFIGGAKNDR
jgi:hypothetical protein